MRKINIFVIACFAFFAHLQASCGLSPSTIEEMARELYTQQVRKAFNFHPVVIAGEEVIPYYHNPIPKGVMVCQAEAKFLEAESAKSILYSPNLTSCQLVVIRNETTKRTGMYSLDQFFNLAGIPETLNSYGSRELISVRIVVNKTFINEKSERDLQPVYGEFGVDKHLRTIANLFEVEGITPTVLNLTVNTEIASNLFRSFFPESGKEFEDYLMKLSKDPSSKLCVDKETGQLYWWSSSLVRKTTHPFVQDITKPTFMERYDRVLAAKLQNVKEIAEERLREKSAL